MLESLTSLELSEWIAFAGIEGLNEERSDFRAGQICATVFNQHRRAAGDRLFDPGDFFPALKPPEPPAIFIDDPEQQSALTIRAFGLG